MPLAFFGIHNPKPVDSKEAEGSTFVVGSAVYKNIAESNEIRWLYWASAMT